MNENEHQVSLTVAVTSVPALLLSFPLSLILETPSDLPPSPLTVWTPPCCGDLLNSLYTTDHQSQAGEQKISQHAQASERARPPGTRRIRILPGRGGRQSIPETRGSELGVSSEPVHPNRTPACGTLLHAPASCEEEEEKVWHMWALHAHGELRHLPQLHQQEGRTSDL